MIMKNTNEMLLMMVMMILLEIGIASDEQHEHDLRRTMDITKGKINFDFKK